MLAYYKSRSIQNEVPLFDSEYCTLILQDLSVMFGKEEHEDVPVHTALPAVHD